MLRALLIAATLLTVQTAAAQGPDAPVAAETPAHRLFAALRLAELMPLLQAEAIGTAEAMAAGLFPAEARAGWPAVVGRINAPAHLESLARGALDRAAAAQPGAAIEAAIAFYDTPLGRQLLALELSAREALLAPGAEEAARAALIRAEGRREPRLARIRALIAQGDLLEPNVAGALNAALAFWQGYAAAGGFETPMTEAQILDQTSAQAPAMRAETQRWLELYLLLAYAPLSEADLDRYARFMAAPEGRTLSAVLFAAFDAMFRQTAREMGAAAAGHGRGQAL